MKAIVHTAYGAPRDVLECREVPAPSIADDEVLVRVKATSVHADVWHVVVGRPLGCWRTSGWCRARTSLASSSRWADR